MATRNSRDERVSHDHRRTPPQGEPERGSRATAYSERMDDGLALSPEVRDQMLRDNALQNMLPTPPRKPGIHWFWASMTMTGGATPTWYKRMGYEAVRFDDPVLKGWADANLRSASGEYAGCVTVNEMLLMKCNETDYQRYMRILHHDKPNEEAQRVADMVSAMKGEVGEQHLRPVTGRGETDGFSELERSTRVRGPQRFD